MKSKPAASAETILIWVRYRDDSPVWFTMPVSSNVNDLLDSVILNPYIGFDGYKGPIKIYENERGDKLEPWLKVSSIRSTTWLTPLVVKIPDDCKVRRATVVITDFLDFRYARVTFFDVDMPWSLWLYNSVSSFAQTTKPVVGNSGGSRSSSTHTTVNSTLLHKDDNNQHGTRSISKTGYGTVELRNRLRKAKDQD